MQRTGDSTSTPAHDAAHNRSTSTQWDATYATKGAPERSWSEDVPDGSLLFIDGAELDPSAGIIDVGGGSSRLVDQLLARGFSDVTVLDISSAAIDEARGRVDDNRVQWIIADVTEWIPARTYVLWHDRAAFHFLTSPADRARYVATATRAIEAGGHLVLATFTHSGPPTCSGLAVQRWSGHELTELFAHGFTFIESAVRDHVTPWGAVQPFTWVTLQRRAG